MLRFTFGGIMVPLAGRLLDGTWGVLASISEYGWVFTGLIALVGVVVATKTYRRRYTEAASATIAPSIRPYKIALAFKHHDGTKTIPELYLKTEWECSLINLGDRALNIVSWGILPQAEHLVIHFPELFKIRRATTDSMNAEIVRVHKMMYTVATDEEIPFPLDIPPGSSASFKIKIALPLDWPAWERVQKEINANKFDDDTQEVFRFAREQNFSLFAPHPPATMVPVYFKTALKSAIITVAFFGDVGMKELRVK